MTDEMTPIAGLGEASGVNRLDITGTNLPYFDLQTGKLAATTGDQLKQFFAETGVGDDTIWQISKERNANPIWNELGLGGSLPTSENARLFCQQWLPRVADAGAGVILAELAGHKVPRVQLSLDDDDPDKSLPLSAAAVISTFYKTDQKWGDIAAIAKATHSSVPVNWGTRNTREAFAREVASSGYQWQADFLNHLRTSESPLYDLYKKEVKFLIKSEQMGRRVYQVTQNVVDDMPEAKLPEDVKPMTAMEMQTPPGRPLPAEYAGHEDEGIARFVIENYDTWAEKARADYQANPGKYEHQMIEFSEGDMVIRAIYYADQSAPVADVVIKRPDGRWTVISVSNTDSMDRFVHPNKSAIYTTDQPADDWFTNSSKPGLGSNYRAALGFVY